MRSRVANADVGAFCGIGPNVRIGPGLHPTRWVSTHPVLYSNAMQSGIAFCESRKFEDNRPIIIGRDVWIGANALVLDGVSVGHGAVIAAGAVITKDVPPYAIVGGVPGKVLKMPFDSDTIDQLL